jgi:hypothetical protein
VRWSLFRILLETHTNTPYLCLYYFDRSLIQRASAAVGLKAPVRLANLVGRQGAGMANHGMDNLPPPSRRHLFVRQVSHTL